MESVPLSGGKSASVRWKVCLCQLLSVPLSAGKSTSDREREREKTDHTVLETVYHTVLESVYVQRECVP